MCVCDIRGKRGEGENETRDKVENRKEEGASEEDRGTKQTWSGVEWVMDAGKRQSEVKPRATTARETFLVTPAALSGRTPEEKVAAAAATSPLLGALFSRDHAHTQLLGPHGERKEGRHRQS